MSVLIQIIGPKKKKHNFHLQNWRTPGRLASLDRRARRRARDVRGRHASRHRFFHARPGGTFFAGRLGCARRRRSLGNDVRSEEHTSELQSRGHLVCRLLLEKKKKKQKKKTRQMK